MFKVFLAQAVERAIEVLFMCNFIDPLVRAATVLGAGPDSRLLSLNVGWLLLQQGPCRSSCERCQLQSHVHSGSSVQPARFCVCESYLGLCCVLAACLLSVVSQPANDLLTVRASPQRRTEPPPHLISCAVAGRVWPVCVRRQFFRSIRYFFWES